MHQVSSLWLRLYPVIEVCSVGPAQVSTSVSAFSSSSVLILLYASVSNVVGSVCVRVCAADKLHRFPSAA